MAPEIAISGALTLYAQQAYGGWTAHAHDARRQRWAHQWNVYFRTKEEAQTKAVELGETLTGSPLRIVRWI